MVNQTNLAMDIALFLAVFSAAGVNLYYLPAWWRVSRSMALMRILRIIGWVILGVRFGVVLLTSGNILISSPSAIGLFFLTAGEIAALFNRGKVGKL